MNIFSRAFLVFASSSLMAIAIPKASAEDAPFANSRLLALSDGAMLASGYIDGLLGERRKDLLSVLSIGKNGGLKRATVQVSNSVATWPNILDVSADGRYAIVTEPFAQPPENAKEFSEIKRGRTISVVDISDPKTPIVVQTVDTGSATAAVDIHPDGNVVAVTLPFDGKIALYPFQDGRLGTPTLHDLQIKDLRSSFVPEFKWRPNGDFAAITLGGAELVAFYRYVDGALSLWGSPVRTAPLPGKGEWTVDGEHFIVTTITATADMAQLGYGQNTSLFAVFDFDADDAANSPPRRANDRKTAYRSSGIQHARIAHVPNGMGYVESFAISPDGLWIVAANMVASWLPKDHEGRTTYSELTLFELDPETARLTPRGTTQLDGVILPQGVVFDRTGGYIAVTSFQHDDRDGGSLSFWKLIKGAAPRLEPAGDPIAMPRGTHFLARVN